VGLALSRGYNKRQSPCSATASLVPAQTFSRYVWIFTLHLLLAEQMLQK
jgi:hypothetical protein